MIMFQCYMTSQSHPVCTQLFWKSCFRLMPDSWWKNIFLSRRLGGLWCNLYTILLQISLGIERCIEEHGGLAINACGLVLSFFLLWSSSHIASPSALQQIPYTVWLWQILSPQLGESWGVERIWAFSALTLQEQHVTLTLLSASSRIVSSCKVLKKNTNRIIFLIPKLKNAQQTLWKFVSVNMSRACGYNAALMWRQWGMAEFWEEAADLSFWDCWVPSSLVQYSERICAVEENWEQERREMIYLNWRGYSIFHCYELLVPQLSVS